MGSSQSRLNHKLLKACRRDNTTLIKKYLGKGAKPTGRHRVHGRWETCLDYAIRHRDIEAVRLLLRHGARHITLLKIVDSARAKEIQKLCARYGVRIELQEAIPTEPINFSGGYSSLCPIEYPNNGGDLHMSVYGSRSNYMVNGVAGGAHNLFG